MGNYVIKMKKTVISSIFALLIFGSSIIAVQAPSVEDDYGIYSDPLYAYDVNVDDEFVYNIIFNITLGFENVSVVDEIDRWINATFSSDEIADIDESWLFLSDFVDYINQDFQINFTLTEKYAEWDNDTDYWSGNTRYHAYDVFNASILVRETGDEDWITPTDFQKNKVDEFAEILVNNTDLEADDTDLVAYVDMVKEGIDEEDMDWDNTEISRLQSDYKFYSSNGTQYDPTTDPDYDPSEPQPPLEHFEPAGLPFFLPNTFNFSEWLSFLEDGTDYDVSQTNETERNYDSFADFTSKMGIIALKANTHGIGIAFSSDDVDDVFFEQETDINLTAIEESLTDYQALFHGAIEYDEDFALASFVSYADTSFSLDTMDLLADNESAPYIDDEPFHLAVVTSIVREGYTAPTPTQIEAGEIGDDRDMEEGGNLLAIFDNIPGYPTAILGILGLVSIAGLIIKNRK